MQIISMFVFELTYRARVSPVTLLHHVAAIVLAQWQIAGEVNGVALTNPMPRVLSSQGFDSQFVLIMMCVLASKLHTLTPDSYGAFECVFELWMHVACILHRNYKSQPIACSRLWLAGGSVHAGSDASADASGPGC